MFFPPKIKRVYSSPLTVQDILSKLDQLPKGDSGKKSIINENDFDLKVGITSTTWDIHLIGNVEDLMTERRITIRYWYYEKYVYTRITSYIMPLFMFLMLFFFFWKVNADKDPDYKMQMNITLTILALAVFAGRQGWLYLMTRMSFGKAEKLLTEEWKVKG